MTARENDGELKLQWKSNKKLPWTVNVADEDTIPRIFFPLHVYTPPSCDVTSLIIRPPPDCTVRLSAGRLEFSFSHVTWGTGFPLTSHCNEAIPVSFTTMDIGGDTNEGAEMDSWIHQDRPWVLEGLDRLLVQEAPDLLEVRLVLVVPEVQLARVCLGDQAFLVFPWLLLGNAPCRPGYSSPV